MYKIGLGLDGIYYCEGKLQDGTERWEEKTFQAAIKSMKAFAKAANGTKIKKRQISYFREVTVTKSEWLSYVPVF